MSVVIETTLGDLTVDLYLNERPRACLNFLKLCKIKYYNFNLFHTISRGFIAQTGDPTGSRTGGECIFGVIDGNAKRYFASEKEPRIKHTKMGLISFVGDDESMIGSQFFLTLGENLTYLDQNHCVFGEVVEGFDVLETINEVICDTDDRPYQDVRITHTVILDDTFPDPEGLSIPSRSPSPSAERLQGGRIAPDEEIDEAQGKSLVEVTEMQAEREAKARATILEMVGDIPDADMAPPENVLFVCKLNPVTTDDDLEVIFNRFGTIKSCEVIRDRKTGDSLQYAFIEFKDKKSCEDAYFKMDNILIDDRRIHVDFSQSVSKIKWHGKGRGVTYYENFNKNTDKMDVDKKNYFNKNNEENWDQKYDKRRAKSSKSPNRKRRSSPERSQRNKYERRRYDERDSYRSRERNEYGKSKKQSRRRRSASSSGSEDDRTGRGKEKIKERKRRYSKSSGSDEDSRRNKKRSSYEKKAKSKRKDSSDERKRNERHRNRSHKSSKR